MKTQCLHCKKQNEIPDEYIGKTIKCTFCKRDFLAIKEEVVPQVKPVENDKKPSLIYVRSWTPPDNDYLQAFGVLAIVAAIFCIVQGTTICVIGGFLLFFLAIVIIGIGTIIRAINANTEEIKKTKSE